jgi:hypothetical protein
LIVGVMKEMKKFDVPKMKMVIIDCRSNEGDEEV